MYNGFFIKKRDNITLEDVIKLTSAKAFGNNIDLNAKINDVKTLKTASEQDVSFFTNIKYIKDFKRSSAGFCFIQEKSLQFKPEKMIALVVNNPHYAYTQLLNEMFQVPLFIVKPGISERAFIDKTATIGKGVEIQDGAYIAEGVEIGDGSKISANAVINTNCKIGKNTFIGANTTISYSIIGDECIIHNGACIGQCGFGFAHNELFNYKVPQLGIVRIGNTVEIGANVCIDRGAFDDTEIGSNTKIDNLIHIAHGVKIGGGCFLAAMTGIAGSTKIGSFAQIGGASGISGHLNIGDGAQIAAKSGVMRDVLPMQKVGGSPALPFRQWLRSIGIMDKLLKKEERKDERE